MSDPANHTAVAARGNQAAGELRETQAAFDAVKAAILHELVQTPPTNADKILTLHKSAQILDAVRHALVNVVQNGQVAAHAIAEAGLTRTTA